MGAFFCTWCIFFCTLVYYLKEFLSALKNRPWARIYSSWAMIRRLLLVSVLVLGRALNIIYLVSSMIVIQIVYLWIITVLRPFQEFKNNLIAIINEVYYFVLIILLIHFNSSEKWNDVAATAYMYLIMSNSLTIILILAGKFISFPSHWN